MPKISVVMPFYNGEKYLPEAIESITNQTFGDFEFIIINEFGSSDEAKEILNNYANKDDRIKIIQNSVRLYLPESLNVGIRAATGEYIARVDVDDPSYPSRFEKQVAFLDANLDVFLCGTLQRSVTTKRINIQDVPCDYEELKATFLFGCDITHSSVMMRREQMIKNDWWYSSEFLAEDCELWTRIMHKAKFVNLNEVLLDRRWGFGNISITRGKSLVLNDLAIYARVFEKIGIDMSQWSMEMFGGFRTLPRRNRIKDAIAFMDEGYAFLCEIEDKNNEIQFFSTPALHKMLVRRWNEWICAACGKNPSGYPGKRFIVEEQPEDVLEQPDALPDEVIVHSLHDKPHNAILNNIALNKTTLDKGYSAKIQSDVGIQSIATIETSANEYPLVSIVMPILNGKEYLYHSLESILKQTYTNWELIVINEYGSNDGSAEIVKGYMSRDQRIHLIQNNEKLGISASLNVGLQSAVGKYIARMDSDDICLPNRLSLQVTYMEAHTECGLIGCRVEEFGDKIIQWNIETRPEVLHSDILFYSPCVHPTAMMRRSVLEDNDLRYNPDFVANEDYELFAKISHFSGIANIEDVLLRYRVYSTNATNRNNHKGMPLYLSVMQEQFTRLGLAFTEKQLKLLCVHYSLKGMSGAHVIQALIDIDLLLKNILRANEKTQIFDRSALFITLHKRYMDAYNSLSWACHDYDEYKVKEFFEKSIFSHREFYRPIPNMVSSKKPAITIILPAYNSEKYIADTLWSLLEQTFTDFECLIMNEYGSDDDTLLWINMFEDGRVRVVQNDCKLGLAKSLNLGIQQARGLFIARADADDFYVPERLEKQYNFLQENPEVVICGTWQRHFGIETDFIHRPPVDHDDLKTQFIYYCEMCHSTLMMRRSDIVANELFYDPNALAEDYELWTRAVHVVQFANIPLVLCHYRVGEDNITKPKQKKISIESGIIATQNIISHLDVIIPENHVPYMGSWINYFNHEKNKALYETLLDEEKRILRSMWEGNMIKQVYNQESLLTTINRRWRWVTNTMEYGNDIEVLPLETLFSIYDNKTAAKKAKLSRKARLIKGIRKILGTIIRPVKNRAIRPFNSLRQQLWDLDGHLKDAEMRLDDRIVKVKDNILEVMDSRIWKAECNLLEQMDSRIWKAEDNILGVMDSRIWKAELQFNLKIDDAKLEILKINEEQNMLDKQVWRVQNIKYIPYKKGEKIRLVFLFQIASFWPSWDTLWDACTKDSMIDAQMVLYNRTINEAVQIESSEAFLQDKGIEYTPFEDFDMDTFKPHIVVYQTPYDEYHRPQYLWASVLDARGYRVVYIPYGIEISNTEKAQRDHFKRTVVQHAWRVYTFSEAIRNDYLRYVPPAVVKALGHPKFDRLYDKIEIPNTFMEDIRKQAAGRKIVLWKVHFPFATRQNNGKEVLATPELSIYLDFSYVLADYPEFFFIFMPHPKFFQMSEYIYDGPEITAEILENIENLPNSCVFMEDDYRQIILETDYAIVDRSAVMVELGVLGNPVLFMANGENYEVMTEAITPLIDSFYKGILVDDMVRFLDMCKNEQDPKRTERLSAIKQCVPLFDNKAGERIKENIVQSLIREQKQQ